MKIQALFSGVYTRFSVKQRYGFQAKTMSGMTKAYAFGESNYDNERVQEIKRQFGEFRYPVEQDDGEKRVKKEEFKLENGARYKGE